VPRSITRAKPVQNRIRRFILAASRTGRAQYAPRLYPMVGIAYRHFAPNGMSRH
jgi:hypothetical protein